MSDRRFTDKPDLAPWAVRALAPDHPAMRENRSLFPSTVVDVTADGPDRILVSGVNNRKIGETVEKGRFKGWGIYGLSLEERATCPVTCAVRDICYGNGMQMARRHRIVDPDTFFDRLQLEIMGLCEDLPGLLIRLHVLGDFPSVEYVAFWADVLSETENVACYGYTRWAKDSDIGDAIAAVKSQYPDRFRIRWSDVTAQPDGAVVLGHIPKGARAGANEIVCPAQRDTSECCATCALCWEPGAAKECIAFIKHGPKSDTAAAESAMKVPEEIGPEPNEDNESGSKNGIEELGPETRRIAPVPLPASVRPAQVFMSNAPECRMVDPASLTVEDSYQRQLSGKSISLIRKIVSGWDWAKFKPPVCAEQNGALFVIDGQHTAIAAATHPDVARIPVMVVKRDAVEKRAAAFVSQNTDRVAMNPFQIFYAEIAAKEKEATEIMKAVLLAGGSIPRTTLPPGKYEVGQVTAIAALRRVYRSMKQDGLERVMRIAVAAKYAPVNAVVLRSLEVLLTEPEYSGAAAKSDEEIAEEFHEAADTTEALDDAARTWEADLGLSKYHAVACVIGYALNGEDADDEAA